MTQTEWDEFLLTSKHAANCRCDGGGTRCEACCDEEVFHKWKGVYGTVTHAPSWSALESVRKLCNKKKESFTLCYYNGRFDITVGPRIIVQDKLDLLDAICAATDHLESL